MNINELKTKPIWQMTGEEFLYLHQNGEQNVTVNQPTPNPTKKYVYGILGIAQLFGCSMPTAQESIGIKVEQERSKGVRI